MISRKNTLAKDLHFFLAITATLLIIGCLFIYSSSTIYALETFGDPHYFVKKQLIGIGIGIIALIVGTLIPLVFIKTMIPLFLLGSLAITSLTLFSNHAMLIHGSSRWIRCFGFSFQPSELLKIAFILYLGKFFSSKSFTSLWNYTPLIFFCCITSGILLKQPDFGLTMTLLCTVLTLFFIIQKKVRYVISTFILLIIFALGLIIMQPYRVQRIATFLDPWQDPKGKGFQIIQSFIAIGSGGWLGIGIGHSKQKFFYLPMQHTDFIFSIIAEETGFIGSSVLILLYVFFLYFGFRIAKSIKDPSNSFTILAFIILTGLQSIINIAVTTGFAPTKGIGLPLISYGNTTLVCTLGMIGIIINMVRQDKKAIYP